MMNLRVSLLCLGALLLVPACATSPEPAGVSERQEPPAVEAPLPEDVAVSEPETDTGETPLQAAIRLLDAGREDEALGILEAILKERPSSSTAILLRRQITTDPATLLGAEHQVYVVQPGDTLSALAASRLGDPLLFHALAKYNGLGSAQSLAAGASIKIPRAPEGHGSPSGNDAQPQSREAPATLSVANVEKSRNLRREGLQALNAGQTDLAVELLASAYDIDHDNQNLKRDLERARSIQQAVER